MYMKSNKQSASAHAAKLLQLAGRQGFIRPKDLEALQIPRAVLQRLVAKGLLVRRSRGVYAGVAHEFTAHTDLAAATRRVPNGVICLLSALRFHELTTQNPTEVWIMIERSAWRPRVEHPPLRIVRATGASLRAGLDQHVIEGVGVRMTNPAKTVADCFKYRNRIGRDVAIEALRECWNQHKATMDDIRHFAEVDRVARVMRPYVEAIV